MIVSLPVDTTSHECSEPSTVRTLDDLIAEYGEDHYISKDMDIRDLDEGDIFRYSLDDKIHVVPYKDTDNYSVGAIVVKDGHHHIITEVDNSKRYGKEPEEYAVETDIKKWKTWTKRYFKVPSNGSKCWVVGDRVYYFYDSKCPPCVGRTWKAWDRTTNGCYADLYQCMKNNISNKYDEAKDIKGQKKVWGGSASVKEETLVFKSAIKRGSNWYLRTWTDAAVEYHTQAGRYTLRRVYSPEEIEGFRFNRKTACGAAFDDKNYTKGVFNPSSGFVDFSFVTSGWADTFVLGRVFAETVSLTARDDNGNVIFNINNYPIKNEIGGTNIGQDVNLILYSNTVLPPSSKVNIRIKAGEVSIGRILAGRMLKLGFTNTIFDNGFNDFSPKEIDQWGNVLYKNGVRVYNHVGTVDMPLKDYDALNRAFMYIGGREMIINSSDSINNTPPNSIDIFQSTMMIGRFQTFKQKTRNVGAIMDSIAGYTFSIREST